MKKITKILVLTLGLIFGMVSNYKVVNAATANSTETGWFFERRDSNHHASDKFLYYDIDGVVSYCIEPRVHVGTDKYLEGTWEDTGLSNDIKERIILIGYYGYTYPNHQTIEYRAATQAMMWETIMGEGSFVKFTKEYWGEGKELDITNERNEIEKLISQHSTRPSFNGGTYKVQMGETLTLVDKNKVLSEYDISVSGAEYTVNGNTLTITPKSGEKIDVTLTKRMPYKTGYKFFVGDEIQNMIVPGTSDPVIGRFRINTYFPPVEVYKTDSETGTAQGQALLKGAEYGVFETATGNLVATGVTDENGYFKIEGVLSWNDYYLQEIKPSEGYELDKTRYNIDAKGKETITLNVVENVIKNYVSILKQYSHVEGETKFLNAEENIVFEIYYPNGNKLDEITTDKNGYATINLPYGVWKFHQVNTTAGYEKVHDFYITVSETSKKEQYYNILNNSFSAYLQVIKVDEETGKTIAIANTTFKILNIDTNQYVSQFVGGEVVSEFTTSENGILVTPLKLESGNYKLIEISAPNGYLKDKNGLTFSIGNDTHYEYTTYGALVTVTYNNTPVKGYLEIYKIGEKFVIKDGNYVYETKKLDGVTFEIYADKDILSSDGNHLYFHKGDKVDTIVTDKNGYAKTKKLPLGSYYLIEVKTQDNYVLDENKHYFTLKQIDDLTAVIYESYSGLNYLKKGSIEITKTDLFTNNPIEDVLLEIYTDKDELIFSGRTGKDGKISLNDIKVGKYYAIEREAATGYVLTEDKLYFEIKEDKELVKETITNKPFTGTLHFSKVDFVTGESLPNTLIEIYNVATETLVFSGRTNEFGEIVIPELIYGRYYILEKEAPENYILNSERMYFEIKEDGEIVKATMTNEKITIDVPITGITDIHIVELLGIIVALAGIGVALHARKN